MRAVPSAATDQRLRCIAVHCGRFHNGLPVLERDGERRQVRTLRCPACAQVALDCNGWSMLRAWDAGTPV